MKICWNLLNTVENCRLSPPVLIQFQKKICSDSIAGYRRQYSYKSVIIQSKNGWKWVPINQTQTQPHELLFKMFKWMYVSKILARYQTLPDLKFKILHFFSLFIILHWIDIQRNEYVELYVVTLYLTTRQKIMCTFWKNAKNVIRSMNTV